MACPNAFTSEQKDLYRSVCDILSSQDIQKLYFPNISAQYLRDSMAASGIHKRRIRPNFKRYNAKFFDIIGPIQCYYAGLICSDGTLQKRAKSSYRLVLKLKDRELLEQFKLDIDFEGDIETQKYQLKNKEYAEIYTISLSGIQYNWKKNLEEIFKVVPNKTYSLTPPNLTDSELIKAYIKGYIDGDGTICIDKRKRLILGVCSHELIMMEWMKEFISQYIPISNQIYYPTQWNGEKSVYILQVSGDKAFNIGKLIESSVNRGLIRKWSKLEEWRNEKCRS